MVTVVTNLGRNGLSDWLMQRVTAVILLAYIVFLAGFFFSTPELGYAEWKDLFTQTWMRIFSLAALLSIVMHAWIGMWAISTDYFTERLMGNMGNIVRAVFQMGCVAVLFVYVVWGIQILWGN
jgi:succinate dehydrogenase / fumarate reductase membrane anchor subunit